MFGIEATTTATYDPTALDEADSLDDIRHRRREDPVRSIGELVDLLRSMACGYLAVASWSSRRSSERPTAARSMPRASSRKPGKRSRIAVSFGPLHGPISARQVEDVLRDLAFAPYHAVLFAGFAIDGSAQQLIQNYRTPKNLQLLMANIAADVLVPDLLRHRRGQQLFAVFGEPDIEVRAVGADEFEVELFGMDVYDPATGEVTSTPTASRPGSWTRTTTALVPDQPGVLPRCRPRRDPWRRLSTALRGWVDPGPFEMLRGTTSLPFRAASRAGSRSRSSTSAATRPSGSWTCRERRQLHRPSDQGQLGRRTVLDACRHPSERGPDRGC